jgi:hypothetical protein
MHFGVLCCNRDRAGLRSVDFALGSPVNTLAVTARECESEPGPCTLPRHRFFRAIPNPLTHAWPDFLATTEAERDRVKERSRSARRAHEAAIASAYDHLVGLRQLGTHARTKSGGSPLCRGPVTTARPAPALADAAALARQRLQGAPGPLVRLGVAWERLQVRGLAPSVLGDSVLGARAMRLGVWLSQAPWSAVSLGLRWLDGSPGLALSRVAQLASFCASPSQVEMRLAAMSLMMTWARVRRAVGLGGVRAVPQQPHPLEPVVA